MLWQRTHCVPTPNLTGRMAPTPDENLLANLADCDQRSAGADSQAFVGQVDPTLARSATKEKLDALIERIQVLTAERDASGSQAAVTAQAAIPEVQSGNQFLPIEPESLHSAGLTDTQVESLVLKFLLARGDGSGREIADQLKLPFLLIDELLRTMKSDQLVAHKGAAPMNDFQYLLSDVGRERARRQVAHCTYFGAAPVSLADYVASVKAQSLVGQQPTVADLQEAFADLLLGESLLDRLGPA